MPKPKLVRVQAAAKVNLSLQVGALQPDGYHPVETLYQAVDLYDTLEAVPAVGISITVQGEGAEAAGNGPSNLAWRAAALLAESAEVEPNVHLRLTKRIPVAGGMAGGSADAAAALVACDALWQLNTSRAKLLELAGLLGSDIPFSVVGGTELGRGRGDQLTTVLAKSEFHWVFALSEQGLSTPSVYAEYDRLAPEAPAPRVSAELLQAVAAGDIRQTAKLLDNNLQAAALSLRPDLKRVLAAGADAGALAGIVSGSGPTCAFLARTREQALELAVRLQASGRVTRTVVASGPVRGTSLLAVEY